MPEVLEQLEQKPQEEKPWKGICSPRCWTAKKKKCRCKCHGQYHQHGLVKNLADMEGGKDETSKHPD